MHRQRFYVRQHWTYPPTMSLSGVNKAVTEDGATYNRLRRPDDYLQLLTAPPPAPVKRKLDAVQVPGEQGEEQPGRKRPRERANQDWDAQAGADAKEVLAEEDVKHKAGTSTRGPLRGDARRVFRPVKENGMQTMFPGLDDDSASDADDTTKDALAYLRSVR